MIKRIIPFIATAVTLCLVLTIGFINKNKTAVRATKVNYNSVSEIKTSSDKSSEPMKGVWVTYMELSMQYDDDKSEGAFKNKFTQRLLPQRYILLWCLPSYGRQRGLPWRLLPFPIALRFSAGGRPSRRVCCD